MRFESLFPDDDRISAFVQSAKNKLSICRGSRVRYDRRKGGPSGSISAGSQSDKSVVDGAAVIVDDLATNGCPALQADGGSDRNILAKKIRRMS